MSNFKYGGVERLSAYLKRDPAPGEALNVADLRRGWPRLPRRAVYLALSRSPVV